MTKGQLKEHLGQPAGLLLVLAGALAAGCAPLQAPVQPAVVVAPPAPAPVAAAERELLSQLAASSLYEIEVSRLAAARATSPRVRSYARGLAAHRVQSWQQLGALMRARGMQVPTRPEGAAAAKLQRLAAVPPSAEFDAAYLRVVGIEDPAETVALLERARLDTRDPQLVAWIDRSLPVLRGDMQAARQLLAHPAG